MSITTSTLQSLDVCPGQCLSRSQWFTDFGRAGQAITFAPQLHRSEPTPPEAPVTRTVNSIWLTCRLSEHGKEASSRQSTVNGVGVSGCYRWQQNHHRIQNQNTSCSRSASRMQGSIKTLSPIRLSSTPCPTATISPQTSAP